MYWTEINHSAYTYAGSTQAAINEICAPLFKTKITTFAYFRFFNNGRYLYLCNNLPWLKFCLEKVHSNEGTALGKEINAVSESHFHSYLWPQHRSDYLLSALYDFNIWNGLSIFKHREDGSIELWGFASNKENEGMQNFYIENIALLQEFTVAFTKKAARLILPAEEKLAIYKDFKLEPKLGDEEIDKKLKKFFHEIKNTQTPILTGEGEAYLTPQEITCLKFLTFGKSYKKISRNLNISPRTIEKHFENIRKKLFCSNRAEMIALYKYSLENWF